MKRNVVNVMLVLLVVMVVGLAGCGGGGGDSGGTSTPATISNLSGSRSTATLNEGAGSVPVTLTVDFIDAGGDVVSMTIESYDVTTGVRASTDTLPISGVSGLTSGRIQNSIIVETTTRGSWNIKIFVTDNAGTKSNTLNTTWAVL